MQIFNIYERSIKLSKEPSFDEVCYRINDILNQLRKDHIIAEAGNLKYYMAPVMCNTIEDTKGWYTFVLLDTNSYDSIDITCIYHSIQGSLDIRMDYYKDEGEYDYYDKIQRSEDR